MARSTNTWIAQSLTNLLPRRRIVRLAAKLGVVRRRRKLDIVALVHCLVLGFSAGERRTLTGLRRAYVRTTGTRLAPSSFHARFSEELTSLMRTLSLEALQRQARMRPRLKGVFAPFVEVLAVDSSLLRLHHALEPFYPSVWRNHTKASAKLGVVINVIGRGAKTVAVTHGSRHDVHLLKAGPWVKGRLLIFDLGFYRATLFDEIRQQGGYFLCRMRKQSNPVIIRSHRREHRHLRGQKLKDAQHLVGPDTLDVEGEVGYIIKRQKHKHYTVRFRFVTLYNEELGQWHRYVTNLPTTMMKARHFSSVYAARWEVELLFRELKSVYRIDQMPSGNRHVTETLIYAALLTLTLNRRLYRELIRRHKLDPQRLPLDRWTILFAAVADELLVLSLHRRERTWRARRIQSFFRAEATDPNRARIPLPYRAQQGLYLRA